MKLNIEIKTRKSASDSILENAQIVWENYAKGFSKYYIIVGSLSCLLIIYGIVDFDRATVMMWDAQFHFHLHLSLIIGIGLFFGLLYVLMIVKKSKRNYLLVASNYAMKHKEIDAIVYRLTDKSFIMDTQLSNSTIDWELFVRKEINGDVVFLQRSKSLLDAIVINCEFLNHEMKRELYAILDEKVKS